MSLQHLQQTWNQLAKKDAMWAVLSGPFASTRKWDRDVFFRTGVDEIHAVFERLRILGMPSPKRALDFGCGLGRLTQALATRFESVDGVDISTEMIRKARSFNRFGDRCRYHLNEKPDLSLFTDRTFDFVYSVITLQHMESSLAAQYIQEFVRVLRVGGVAVFQVPSEALPAEMALVRTVIDTALPAATCRARIVAPRRLTCAPAATFDLLVNVRNEGYMVWPALSPPDSSYSIRLGNHWRSRWGRMLRFDDIRSVIPYDVAAGHDFVVGIRLTAPEHPGVYRLELDMVQEEVRWFASVGSRVARTTVKVDAALQPGNVLGLPPQMSMHCLPRTQVERLVEGAGGVLLAAEPDDAPGPTFVSFRYFVKRADGSPHRW